MADNERDFVWLDIEVTMQDIATAAREAGNEDLRAMLENLAEHLEALRALEAGR
jgi:hypothetical protein